MATNQMHTRLFPCFKDDSFDFYKKRVSNEKKKKRELYAMYLNNTKQSETKLSSIKTRF